MTVLPVRIIMSPTSSSRLLAGRNARSATLRTTGSSSLSSCSRHGRAATAGGEPYATVIVRLKREPSRSDERHAGSRAGAMFARGVSAPRLIPLLAAALLPLAGCGGDRQDADEPTGSFKVDVVRASFPPRQSIAQGARMRIDVRNSGRRTVPQIGVTVETAGDRRTARRAPLGETAAGGPLADPKPPVWGAGREPGGGPPGY